jgi:hypothetical protein
MRWTVADSEDFDDGPASSTEEFEQVGPADPGGWRLEPIEEEDEAA